MRKLVVVLAVAILTAVPVCSFAAVSNDEVTSAKIKEATSGSTSQDTNTGNGIKTNHIVDTAVTTAKIANGAVTDAKITGPISVSKLPVGTTASTVAAGDHSHVIQTANIADGAVTSSKISGVIGADKIATYDQLFVVHKGAVDGVNTFNTISAAVAKLSATSPKTLIKVMPGTYTESIDGSGADYGRNFVLEGSGRELTTIVGAVNRISRMSNISVQGSVFGIEEIRNSSIDGNVQGYGSFRMYDSQVSNGTVGGIMVAVLKNCLIFNGSISVSQYSFVDIDDIDFQYKSNNPDAFISIYGYAGNGNNVSIRNIRTSWMSTPPANVFRFAYGVNAKIYNSNLPSASNGIMLDFGPTNVEVVNSKFVTPGSTFVNSNLAANNIVVVNSQISQTVTDGNLGATKVYNCYDDQYNSIPNQ